MVDLVMLTSAVVDGECYAYAVWKSATIKAVYFLWNFLSFYVVIFVIFVVCYWRILLVIRRQAQVSIRHESITTVTALCHPTALAV